MNNNNLLITFCKRSLTKISLSHHLPSERLKATKVEMKGEKDLQESVSFGHKTELKIEANPELGKPSFEQLGPGLNFLTTVMTITGLIVKIRA